MSGWTADEIATIGTSDELGIASRRPDGTIRPFVTIWFVRLGDDLYVRSAHGQSNPWFQRALASGEGRIRVRGVEHDVAFEEPGPELSADLHAAYHAKYDRYGPTTVGAVVSSKAARSTLRLVPH